MYIYYYWIDFNYIGWWHKWAFCMDAASVGFHSNNVQNRIGILL